MIKYFEKIEGGIDTYQFYSDLTPRQMMQAMAFIGELYVTMTRGQYLDLMPLIHTRESITMVDRSKTAGLTMPSIPVRFTRNMMTGEWEFIAHVKIIEMISTKKEEFLKIQGY